MVKKSPPPWGHHIQFTIKSKLFSWFKGFWGRMTTEGSVIELYRLEWHCGTVLWNCAVVQQSFQTPWLQTAGLNGDLTGKRLWSMWVQSWRCRWDGWTQICIFSLPAPPHGPRWAHRYVGIHNTNRFPLTLQKQSLKEVVWVSAGRSAPQQLRDRLLL